MLRQLLAAGFIDQVAVRKDKVSKDAGGGQQYTTSRGVPYRAVGIEEDVYVHPTSVLAGKPPPDFIVFCEVVRTTKVWVKGECYSLLEGPSLNMFLRPDSCQRRMAVKPG